MEMIDYSKNNEFLGYAYDLFEAVYLEPVENYKISTVTEGKFFKKKKTIKVNTRAEKAYERACTFARGLTLNPPSFISLFDFGTFVKCMEKVFFYKNDLTARTCCDSNLQDKTTRNLIFNLNDIVMILKLEKLNKGHDEYIRIIVKRNFGKKMESEYIIKNAELQYNDCNDLMLINSVNILLSKLMYEYFMMIIDKIYTAKILDIEELGIFYRSTDISVKGVDKNERD